MRELMHDIAAYYEWIQEGATSKAKGEDAHGHKLHTSEWMSEIRRKKRQRCVGNVCRKLSHIMCC